MGNKDLHRVGLKITLPRLKVLQILERSVKNHLSEKHHLSAEDIYRELGEAGENVGLATVYRVLSQFESAGLVVRHNFEGGHAVFELSTDEHHDHLVCVKCGQVKEFVDKVIEQRQMDIAKESGYQMTDHALTIYGLCTRCRE